MKEEIVVVPKGWGFEKIITNGKKYCGKLLHIVKGKKTSLHYHKLKDETFYVQSGRVQVDYTDRKITPGFFDGMDDFDIRKHLYLTFPMEKVILHAGDAFHVPINRVHQILALDEAEVFEFSTQHFDDDSVRLIKGD